MRSRLEDLPRYATRAGSLPAAAYNQGRLAILRLGGPLRFSLPSLRTLDMVLEEDLWVCVDSGLNDYPILAWLDFQAGGRAALHTPVPCCIYSYHAHADMIECQVLEKTTRILAERLHPSTGAP